jgi:hypothetical protein
VIMFASVRLEEMVICPAAPEVLDTRLSREPEASARTFAVTPRFAALITGAAW